jgi:23S rRNA (guanosine2251-2'-O)-methyltransferase
MKTKPTYIYGKHSVLEAIRNRTNIITELFITAEVDEGIRKIIKKNDLFISRKGIPASADKFIHQGYVAKIRPEKMMTSYKEFISDLKITDNTSILILGEVQDPQNVGAIIRSAAAFGVSAVLFPEHNQAQMTGAVVKVSSGMAFKIPLVSIGNVNSTIKDLKDKGFWIYGLAADGDVLLHEEDFSKPSVFVIGNEQKGVREKTKEACDIILSIPIDKKCESLNAATAASVVMYQWGAGRK